MSNILLQDKFNTPYETFPFEKLDDNDFLPAVKEAISIANKDIEKIKKCSESADFKNTIVALEYNNQLIHRISQIFFNLLHADTNEFRQDIAKEISPLLSEFMNKVTLDSDLFERVEQVYKNKSNFDLDIESMKLLEQMYKHFTRNGVKLNDSDKDRLKDIDKKLSELALNFGDNVLAGTNSYEMVLTDESDLAGLPESAIEAAAAVAKAKNKNNCWVITLDFPSYAPFMKYSENRELREKLARASGTKCFKGNNLDNQEIVKEIVRLKHVRANLLGFKTHAEYTLKERMAESSEKVQEFLDNITKHANPFWEKEKAQLEGFMKELGANHELKGWDYAYYTEKLKKKLFNIDDEALRPFLKLENVINGAFTVANKLYGISFKEREDISKYNEDVKTYEVSWDETGEQVGVLFADFFPRAGKKNGAWKTDFRDQFISIHGEKITPIVSIVCNFTKPTDKKPSLLTFNEVRTLFHEFGHALHGLLSNCKYRSLSGTSVYWDFVELPSQIMENWIYEKECLDLFAIHYQTGEKIPEEYVKKIKESSNFHEGYAILRQIRFATLDMCWHAHLNPSEIENVGDLELEAFKTTSSLPDIAGNNMSTQFSHLFQGGYSAGYYSYKWAEVLDADAFDSFKEKGIFNKEVAKSFYENILSRGGSEHPMELFKRFKGREPDVKPLLKRAGLI